MVPVVAAVQGGLCWQGGVPWSDLGADLGLRPIARLEIDAGADFQWVEQDRGSWPVHLGVAVRFSPVSGAVPWFGADLVAVDLPDQPLLRTTGPRARAGLDLPIADRVGVRVQAAMGVRYGHDWGGWGTDPDPGPVAAVTVGMIFGG